MDDTDEARSTEEFAEAIKTDLAWLGLDYDETFKQSDRFGKYEAAFDDLKARGLVYACYETPMSWSASASVLGHAHAAGL